MGPAPLLEEGGLVATFPLKLRTRAPDRFESTWLNPGNQLVTRAIPQAAYAALIAAGAGEPAKGPGVNPNAAWINALQVWRFQTPGSFDFSDPGDLSDEYFRSAPGSPIALGWTIRLPNTEPFELLFLAFATFTITGVAPNLTVSPDPLPYTVIGGILTVP